MTAKLVDLPSPPPKPKPKAPWKGFGAVILVFFIIGLAMGACSLGMKLPVALYDMAVGYVEKSR